MWTLVKRRQSFCPFIWVALEQELCLPTSSQYIRLIVSINTKPHPPSGEHEHIGIPLHYWGVPPSHESTRVLPDQNPYLWSQERGSGHIVNISSDSERVAFPGQKSLLTLKTKLHTRLHRLLGDQVLLGRGVRRAQEGADGNRGKFFNTARLQGALGLG